MKITKFECVEVEYCWQCPYCGCDILDETNYCMFGHKDIEDDHRKRPIDCPYDKKMDREVWHNIMEILVNR